MSTTIPTARLEAEAGSNSLPLMLRPSQVAAALGVSKTWVYAAATDGRLPSIRLGGPRGPLRFFADDIDRWLDEARESRVTTGAQA